MSKKSQDEEILLLENLLLDYPGGINPVTSVLIKESQRRDTDRSGPQEGGGGRATGQGTLAGIRLQKRQDSEVTLRISRGNMAW